MREIKFRAWDTEQQKMYPAAETPISRRMIPLQYTGLQDKNGKEIYEGDIVGVKLSNKKYASATIEWVDREACFGCKWDEVTAKVRKEVGMPNLPANLVSSGSPWEVIGNIYENPELLETKQ